MKVLSLSPHRYQQQEDKKMITNAFHALRHGILFSVVVVLSDLTYADLPLGRFTDPQPIPGLEGSGFADQSPFVTPDELTIYFASDRPPGSSSDKSYFLATRDSTEEPFGEPLELDPPFIENLSQLDASLTFSKDGKTAFLSSRTESQGVDSDLFMVTRDPLFGDWKEPIRLDGDINSSEWDFYPSLSSDELTLYFASSRDGNFDIYTATRKSIAEEFSSAQPLTEVNTGEEDNSPSISTNGLALFLGTAADPRTLSVATRSSTDEPFGRPVRLNAFGLGSDVNFPDAVEFTPFISPNWPADGSKLYYGAAFRPLSGNWELYEATWRVALQAGDADQDLDFDQLDLVKVQSAAKYLTGTNATWGEGDWNGAPEGHAGAPPLGDGVFDQDDIVAALAAGLYLTGPYGASRLAELTVAPSNVVGFKPNGNDVPLEPPVEVESIYIPEPSALLLATIGWIAVVSIHRHRVRR